MKGIVCGVNWYQIRDGVCEIRHTVTKETYKRQGIGSALITAALEKAASAKCRRAFTYIDRNNTASLKMYEKAGFSPCGRMTRQYLRGSAE